MTDQMARLRVTATEAEEGRAEEHRALLALQTANDTMVSELEQVIILSHHCNTTVTPL